MVCKEWKRSVLNFLPKSALQDWLQCSRVKKQTEISWSLLGQDFISRWLSLLFSLKQFIVYSNTWDCQCSSPRFLYVHDLIRLLPCFFLFFFIFSCSFTIREGVLIKDCQYFLNAGRDNTRSNGFQGSSFVDYNVRG